MVRLEQPLKSPVEVTLFGILIEVKPEQSTKALFILVRLWGSLIEIKDLQRWNIPKFSSVIPSAKETSVKLSQPQNV